MTLSKDERARIEAAAEKFCQTTDLGYWYQRRFTDFAAEQVALAVERCALIAYEQLVPLGHYQRQVCRAIRAQLHDAGGER